MALEKGSCRRKSSDGSWFHMSLTARPFLIVSDRFGINENVQCCLAIKQLIHSIWWYYLNSSFLKVMIKVNPAVRTEEEESGMTKMEKKLWSCVSAYDALHQLNVICWPNLSQLSVNEDMTVIHTFFFFVFIQAVT